VINLDKSSAPSSHEVVSWVKRILGAWPCEDELPHPTIACFFVVFFVFGKAGWQGKEKKKKKTHD
jgi:tRNA U55 pseudouridine synthase TruB